MAGEEDPEVERSLAGKSIPTRIMVLGAGSLVNALLPLLLFSLAFMIPHKVLVGEIAVESVAPASPAAAASIEAGDILLEFDSKQINSIADLQPLIQMNLGEEVSLLIRKSDASIKTVQLTPRWKPPEGEGAMGVILKTANYALVRQNYSFPEAVTKGATQFVETYILLKNGIIRMIIGAAPLQFGGPIAIAQITSEAAHAGISPLLEFAAFLSINLAILNILPLPALDGGRILFVLIEWLRGGKRISAKTEGLVHLIGFAGLMAFVAVVSLTDIIRIINGGSLIP